MLIGLLLVLVVAMGARTWVAYEHVFANPDEVKLLGVDSFFHLRHAKYTLNNYPDIQRFDIGASYPHGRQNDATGLFGFTISTAALLAYGKDATLNDIATIAAWFTPILALLAYVLLFLLVRQLITPPFALIAVVIFLLYPGKSLDRSVLGFVDHHVVEYCLVLAIIIGLISMLKTAREKPLKAGWKSASLAALPLALIVYTWQGAALFIVVVNIALFAYWTLTVAKEEQVTPFTQVSMRYGVALLLMLLMSASGLMLLVAGSVILILGAWSYSFGVQWLITRYTPIFIAMTISLFVIIVAVLALQLTPVGELVTNLVLSDSTNFIHEESSVTFDLFLNQFGVAGFLAAVGFAVSLALIWKNKLPKETIIPSTIGAIWLVLWWRSDDLGYMVPMFVAYYASITLYVIWQFVNNPFLVKSKAIITGVKTAVITLTVAAFILPIYPFKVVSLPWISQSKVLSMTFYSKAWYSSLDWLQEYSPLPARTPLKNNNASLSPVISELEDYGVMTSWDFGNIVASHGNRIPVWSAFPSSYTARWWLAQNEQESLKLLSETYVDDRAIRYVIVDKDTYGPLIHSKSKFINNPITTKKQGEFIVNGVHVPRITLHTTYTNSMISRLYANDGIELSHYRLVYESSEQTYSAGLLTMDEQGGKVKYNYTPKTFPIENADDLKRYSKWLKADVVDIGQGYLYNHQIQSTIKIFEVVKGIQINGHAQPGDTVQARLTLSSQTTGRQFKYRRSAIVDKQGKFQLTVPYSTDRKLPNSDIVAKDNYEIWIRAKDHPEFILTAKVQVPEASFKERKLMLEKQVD